MATRHLIVHGDGRRLARVPDGSVQLVVTSPPYWQLKDYGEVDQIGFHDTYGDYVDGLNLVWLECVRALAPGGRLCVNVGDQFARAAYYGRYKVIPIRTEITRFLETAGLDHMGAIIWQKVTTCNTSGGATVMGSFPYPPNGIVKIDYEFILIFRKPGTRPERPDPADKEASRLTTEQWNTYFYGHWSFPGVRQDRHLAAYPEELPRRLLRMFTFRGDAVLDPFLGSGTTSVVALQEGRDSVGYEINAGFVGRAEARLHAARDLVTPGEIVRAADPLPVDVSKDVLPYRHEDPVRIDRPRQGGLRRFGSRIDGREGPRAPTQRVVAVPAHDRVRLASGEEVRLLGVGPPRRDAASAVETLAALCLDRRVTVTRDGDAGGGGAAYVHLRNRKFVNAHLIKSGAALADAKACHRHAARFARYAREAERARGGDTARGSLS